MGKVKFAVIGGDLRNVYVSRLLFTKNMLECTYALGDLEIEACDCSEQFFDKFRTCRAVIGPIPFSNDGINVNAPLCDEVIRIDSMIDCMEAGQVLIGGKFQDNIYIKAEANGIHLVDVLKREEMAIMNAVPTAEGAIQIAMEELPITLHGSHSLVLGYGRISKVLSKMLIGLGSEVTVAARRLDSREMAKIMGTKTCKIEDIPKVACKFDVVFNTIPQVIIKEEMLDSFRSDCLIIDMASKPGGIDFDTARRLGIKSIWALSLPGRVAPLTAADIIIKTAFNAINEMEG